MRSLKQEGVSLTFLALSWLLTLCYWNRLPAKVPTHWALGGQPNQWMDMPWGGLFPALLATGIFLLLYFIPQIDPRWQRLTEEAYGFIKNTLMAFFAFMTYLVLSTATQPVARLSVSQLLVGMGLLFILVGNFLPKLRSNFFVGIRTPWTLSSEEVWNRTHRLGGKLMVGMGFLTILAAFLAPTWAFVVVVGASLLFAIWSIGYSLWLFKHLQEDQHASH